jgi:hypothetical protein
MGEFTDQLGDKSKMKFGKNCIVNYVTRNPQYLAGQHRLGCSLLSPLPYCYHAYDLLIFNEDNSQISTYTTRIDDFHSPKHNDNPYAFKIYAIEEALKRGYSKILWLDASIVAKKLIDPIWEWIEEKGFFFEEAGHLVGQWCNDRTLEYFKTTREEAMLMPMFSAGFTGLNFNHEKTVRFFELWKQSMLDGQFIGSWSDHRHDMTCASIIAYKLEMHKEYSKGGNFFAYIGDGYEAPKESAIFHLLGI